MTENATFVIAIGLLSNKSEPEREYTAALELQARMQSQGRTVHIVGDGKSELTIADINREVGKLSGSVELMLVGHGEYVPAGAIEDSRFQHLNGQYVMTIASGNAPDSKTPTTNIEGVEVPFTGLSTIQDIFKAVPSNIVSVTVAACKSERALDHVNLLPKNASLYITARENDVSFDTEIKRAIERTEDRNGNGRIGDDLFAAYAGATFRNRYTNMEERRDLPTEIGVSGVGVVDVTTANLTANGEMVGWVRDAMRNPEATQPQASAERAITAIAQTTVTSIAPEQEEFRRDKNANVKVAVNSYALAELVNSMDPSVLRGLANLKTGDLEVTQNSHSEKPRSFGQAVGGGTQ